MNKYQKAKAAAREAAIRWQHEASQRADSWSDLAEAAAYFERLARRYGLIKEFRENSII